MRWKREERGGEEDETGGDGGRGGGNGGGPRRQMPPLRPWHCWILIVQPHCARLIGNVSAAMLSFRHTLASK